jgi:hypothetical protein
MDLQEVRYVGMDWIELASGKQQHNSVTLCTKNYDRSFCYILHPSERSFTSLCLEPCAQIDGTLKGGLWDGATTFTSWFRVWSSLSIGEGSSRNRRA